MTEWRGINMNNTVRIRLTPIGERILRDYWRPFAGDRDPREIIASKTTDGWFNEQLWEIAHVFGPHLGNGLPIPFETEIQVEISNQ